MEGTYKREAHRRARALRILVGALGVVSAFTVDSAIAQDDERGDSLAVVVHRDVDIDDVTINELRRIFLAEQQYWPDKSRIVLLIREPETHERRIVLERIYEMTEPEFRRYWIAKVFKAEIPSGPKVVLSVNMARDLVSVIPNSITFMRSADAGSDFKVIRVDGKLPDEDGYALNYPRP